MFHFHEGLAERRNLLFKFFGENHIGKREGKEGGGYGDGTGAGVLGLEMLVGTSFFSPS